MKSNLKIVENKKKYFIVSAAIVVLALIMGLIYALTGNGFAKLSMEFQSGYSLNVVFGTDLSRENYDETYAAVKDVVENLKDSKDEPYNIVIGSNIMQGKDETAAIQIKFKPIGSDEYMVDVVDELKAALTEKFFSGANEFSGHVENSGLVTPQVSSELLASALYSVICAMVLMLIYVAFRFELTSAYVAILSILHDVAIMTAFMIIFHIEIGSSFIAAIITILGYSINNTIIIFDRLREVNKNKEKGALPNALANKAVNDVLSRTINTTFTTLITITLVAIIGVPSIRIFALPIIVGLISGLYSSNCISPSIWSIFRNHDLKRARETKIKKAKA